MIGKDSGSFEEEHFIPSHLMFFKVSNEYDPRDVLFSVPHPSPEDHPLF